MSTSILHLDLHPIARNDQAIEKALRNIFDQAINKRVQAVEIISGKGSGQLRLRVKKFLRQPEIRQLYKRVQVDAKNHGRVFVYFR